MLEDIRIFFEGKSPEGEIPGWAMHYGQIWLWLDAMMTRHINRRTHENISFEDEGLVVELQDRSSSEVVE